MIVNEKALLALTPSADQSALEGYFVKLVAGVAVLCSATTDIPFGVIVDGEETTGKSTIAVGAAYPGIVTVKLGAAPGNVIAGSRLTLNADATVNLDDEAGARVIVAIAIQAGAANELIQAVLIRPYSIGAVVLTSTNGTAAAAIPGALTSTNGTAAAAAADLAALAAEAEKIGDDVRAIHAAVLLAQAESEKQGDDIRAIYAALVAAGLMA